MSDTNVIVISGNIGKDATTRTVGDSVVTGFSLANDTGWGDRKKTTWYECSWWGKRGSALAQYLTKGKNITVVGEVSQRQYTKNDGSVGYSLDVEVRDVTLPSKQGDAPKQQDAPQQADDVDIPF